MHHQLQQRRADEPAPLVLVVVQHTLLLEVIQLPVVELGESRKAQEQLEQRRQRRLRQCWQLLRLEPAVEHEACDNLNGGVDRGFAPRKLRKELCVPRRQLGELPPRHMLEQLPDRHHRHQPDIVVAVM